MKLVSRNRSLADRDRELATGNAGIWIANQIAFTLEKVVHS